MWRVNEQGLLMGCSTNFYCSSNKDTHSKETYPQVHIKHRDIEIYQYTTNNFTQYRDIDIETYPLTSPNFYSVETYPHTKNEITHRMILTAMITLGMKLGPMITLCNHKIRAHFSGTSTNISHKGIGITRLNTLEHQHTTNGRDQIANN